MTSTKQNELYLLSGLGADQRVFDFLDLSAYRKINIQWIDPNDGESIEHYAQRLLSQIKTPRPDILAVSFGGLIATEIGKLIETNRIVLISSVKTNAELPRSYRILGRMHLHHIFSGRIMKKSNPVLWWLFGVTTEKERALLKTILAETDERFLTWGIDKLVSWKNRTRLKNVTLIHGTKDRILPHKAADYCINDGGHFMIVNKATEINEILKRLLK